MLNKALPPWIKARYRLNEQYQATAAIINDYSLHTVCQSATCPNQGVCFAEGTATFLILGNTCTRSCRFCAVNKGKVEPVDPDEPHRIAMAVSLLKLDYAVITSVTRDDLADGGAAIFAEVIHEIRVISPGTDIEVLTPDFQGNEASLTAVARAKPDVFNHNLETVPRLYPSVRPEADYHRSLHVLARIKQMQPNVKTKSGLMVGLGEHPEEIVSVLQDIAAAGCDYVTIGQYLAPSEQHHPMIEFVTPEQFLEYERVARKMGLKAASGPLIRSSYHAKTMFQIT